MTREQTQILNLLKKDNKQARGTGKAYLTDTEPLEAFCAKIPKEGATAFLEKYDYYKTELNGNFEQLCFFLYHSCISVSVPIEVHRDDDNPNDDYIYFEDTQLTRELGELLEEISQSLNRLGGKYVDIPQNRAINNLAKTLSIGYQPELINIDNTATSIVRGKTRKEDVRYVIHNYWLNPEQTEAITPSISSLKLFYFLLLVFGSSHKQNIRIPLIDYACLIKDKPPEKISKSMLKEVREQVVKDLFFLRFVVADYQEKINGKWTDCGTDGWNGGTAKVAKGCICWNWNTNFIPELERLAPAIYNKNIFTARLNSDEFFFYDLIDKNYRMNEDKPDRLNTIKIATFLESCTHIPKPDTIKNSLYKLQIMTPFHRTIDNLKDVELTPYNADGEARPTADDWLSFDEFINGYVFIDYSDYPVHPKRISYKRIKAEENRKNKPKKKT